MNINTDWKKILNLEKREVISIVGAGGKTTLMFTLAQSLAKKNFHVISTTTTKIFYPSPQETSIIQIGYYKKKQICFAKNNHITIVGKTLANNKVQGVLPTTVDTWAEISVVDYIVVEADGAKMCALKWPDTTKEPVVPSCTTTVIAVIGGDCFAKHLNEKNVFRPMLFAQKTGIKLGELISLQAISRVFLDADGLFANSPSHAKKVILMNKISGEQQKIAVELAKIINRHSPNIKIIYGHLHPYVSIKEFVK